MEQAAHVWCWGFLFHRWRICVVCVVCLALFLSALLAFFFSSMPRDDDSTWLHRVVFRYPSQNSSSMATTDWGAGARANLFDDPSLELNESVSGAATPGVGERGSGKYFYSAAAGDVAAREVVAPSSPRASAPNHGTVIENRASADAFWDGGSAATEQCDMSVGRWVQDATNYPLYKPGSCPFVDEAFRCQENGRPDSDYLKWRWKPKDCEIPRFNAQNVLERLRGKRLVFAGDSLMRNQWESMLCLLRGGLANESRMLEMRGHHITKGKGDYVFKFLDYKARVEFYRSHFLVAEGKQSRAGSRKARLTLRLDTMDKTARKWRQADVLVFTTGHWWTHGKTAKGKDYFQEGEVVYERLPVMVAFKKALTTWASWIDQNVNPKLTKVFFCSYSPSHFNGGQWNSGGQCHNEKDPIFNESHIPSYPEKMQVVENVIQQMKNPVQILNVTRFSEFRKDAHPSIFGKVPQDNTKGRDPRQDCSHWCLPGLPDIWNEVLHSFL